MLYNITTFFKKKTNKLMISILHSKQKRWGGEWLLQINDMDLT